ncbi:hypothetical protein [Acanthamoeba castellanii mimivirus]|uniref:Uncharacterized protein L631 n=5 Tax=Mimivirus TaxID=315393 RepID=YL631_MIMIV|nr:hypothetical protein MIMI_gp0678 [Acanthamoeba polyphaga mimivirus]Q5UR77.1 RecName: Full=Uncharacterized protein L631 [Acanthamoeba polyphaga mimivirus]AHJ40259.1 hypothetical protein [Samba virus]ALR84219.1 hypothetical protein [Niemeyer virus]AMZ03074.1 hypothetical protein [Mimivirus Bombay]BAV61747.1 hypothetical protein [Acanthamoeba castellanii mimivirus]AAV50892.1 unknown [Acanthamoeba polyphaga mimivirus]
MSKNNSKSTQGAPLDYIPGITTINQPVFMDDSVLTMNPTMNVPTTNTLISPIPVTTSKSSQLDSAHPTVVHIGDNHPEPKNESKTQPKIESKKEPTLKQEEQTIQAEEEAQKIAKEETRESFLRYGGEIIIDIMLGILLGIAVNMLTDYIASIFGLKGTAKFPIQLVLIVIVLYMLRINPDISFPLRSRTDTYGVIFIPIFITAQRNFAIFFSELYNIF